ncbi:MAG TPA: CaiB/BaiF CoA-transferase family protein [Actinomycetes bacterium]
MGPLDGVRVVELAGIGPGPFCAMLLADMGAEVLRVDRPAAGRGMWPPLMTRGRRSVTVDLKHPEGAEVVRRLADAADVLLEGFRPGVAERLGLGPAACLARNPRLVYGRMTGWGQDGPWSQMAGHDINYLALAGALHPLGRRGEAPLPPLNLLGDFGGGGMLLAFGVACALLEAGRSGRGQVVDAAILDGSALLTTMVHELAGLGMWRWERGVNLLDGGAPFYGVYETADGGHVAVGALEPEFYRELLALLGLDGEQDLPAQLDRERWPELRERIAAAIRSRSRDEWAALAEGRDACLTPVLSPAEAPEHPHNRERGVFAATADGPRPAPAPRFDRTPAAAPGPVPTPGGDTDAALPDWGFTRDEVAALRAAGALG